MMPTDSATSISLVQQAASLVSGYGFKPLYMILTLWLIIVLWKIRAPDIRLVRRGLIAFLSGEAFCALNYLIFGGGSDCLDALHALGMAIMGGLVGWGIALFLDGRVLRLTEGSPSCVLRRLCGACPSAEGRPGARPCRLRWLIKMAAPAAAIFCLMPWCLPIRPLRLTADILGARVLFSYSDFLQVIDFRIYPAIALASLSVAALRIWRGPMSLTNAQLPFFAGAGLLSFSLFRFLLLNAFRDAPAWMNFWEETTELIFVLVLAFFLIPHRDRLSGKKELRS